jgi:hypothetical protein
MLSVPLFVKKSFPELAVVIYHRLNVFMMYSHRATNKKIF